MTGPAAIVAAWYLAASLATAGLYAADKSAARRGGRRVSEATLQAWAWVGGWAGALAGQRLLRHKSRQPRMIVGAWLALAAHALGWAGWLISRA
jgi:uncharacterized membrane protein YsdA (DUF1294 family)